MRTFRWVSFSLFLSGAIGVFVIPMFVINWNMLVFYELPSDFTGEVRITEERGNVDYVVVGGVDEFWKKQLSAVEFSPNTRSISLRGITPKGEVFSAEYYPYIPQWTMRRIAFLEHGVGMQSKRKAIVIYMGKNGEAGLLLFSISLAVLAVAIVIKPKRRDEPA